MNPCNQVKINNIKFFNSPDDCISDFKKTDWTKKVISFIQSFGTLFIYSLAKLNLKLHKVDTQMEPLTNDKMRNPTKKRLVVCIHGLNSSPSQFKKIVDEMEKKDLSQTDIFIPRILQKGNAELDQMAKPIFEQIAKWAQTSGEKELVLVGISNGGRIARAIEAEIAQSENTENIKKLRFISIVGACKGAPLVNLINRLGLSRLISKNISAEMPTGSKRNEQLDRDWIAGLDKGPARDYTFIASPHDWQVTNYDSSLMDVKHKTRRYAIIPGHGHNSIVNAAAKPVAEIILN